MPQVNSGVIRFVAYYLGGNESPLSHIILGHGYKEMGGVSHEKLTWIYPASISMGEIKHIYSGYLHVSQDCVLVYEGGSGTLEIPGSRVSNEKLAATINARTHLRQAIIELFPLLTSKKISHIMLGDQ